MLLYVNRHVLRSQLLSVQLTLWNIAFYINVFDEDPLRDVCRGLKAVGAMAVSPETRSEQAVWYEALLLALHGSQATQQYSCDWY